MNTRFQPGDIVRMKPDNKSLMAGPCIIYHYNSVGQPYLLGRRAACYSWDTEIAEKIGHSDDPRVVGQEPVTDIERGRVYTGILAGTIDILQIIRDAGVPIN